MAKDDDADLAPLPRENPDLEGHAAAEAQLLEAWRSGRLPHGWLFTGPQGIGKATLAYRFARFVLAGGGDGGGLFGDPPNDLRLDPAHPIFHRVASGGHSDLMFLEKGKTVIKVEDVRAAGTFLSLTPGEGAWRVVIVDSADDLNTASANALLKVLEEPPDRALLILVSHAPGSLPATVRSRCCRLPLHPLPEATVRGLLGRWRPALAEDDAAALARLGEGSIGRALRLADGGGLALYRQMMDLIAPLPALDVAGVHAFADKLARPGADETYGTAMDLLSWWVARMVRAGADPAAGLPGGEVVAGEADAVRRMAARGALERWVDVWEKIGRQVAQADALNLDRRQVVLGAFQALEDSAR